MSVSVPLLGSHRRPHQALSCLPVQVAKGVRRAWLVHEITDEAVATAQQHGIEQLCPRANVCTPEAVAKAQRAGLSVRGWGVKSIELLLRLRDCGAHGCTVDWPDKARIALGH